MDGLVGPVRFFSQSIATSTPGKCRSVGSWYELGWDGGGGGAVGAADAAPCLDLGRVKNEGMDRVDIFGGKV
jgi:hypothetical protein